MKKILIVSHAMEIGGAERALLGLLESIDPAQVSVDLFLLRHEGELLDLIPDYIHLLPPIPGLYGAGTSHRADHEGGAPPALGGTAGGEIPGKAV